MCGIAGLIMKKGGIAEDSIISLIQQSIAHRGPDGSGHYHKDNVVLIHTRLAIIDPLGGDQPLYGLNGQTLVANGEIYNSPELRQTILAYYPFKTGSDCETILALYHLFGLEGFSHLRGMYAFALHDADNNTVILGRDPFGIKPLYYCETETCFAFASEAQTLIASHNAQRILNYDKVEELLQLQFTSGSETIFTDIHRLNSGEIITLKNGKIIDRSRQSALPHHSPIPITEEKALQDLDTILRDSVRVHQRSDVPYGLFLSSGVDSGAILALMASMNTTPIIAYTASFPDTSLDDEFPIAHIMAQSVKAKHVNLPITAEDFWKYLPQIAASLDDPTADYAIVPTWLLAQRAKQDVKVILCGEGGDELFAGYSRYRRQCLPWWLGGRKRRGHGPFSNSSVLKKPLGQWRNGLIASEKYVAIPGLSSLQKCQAADCDHFLIHDLLNKLDRCLMAHGLEGRTPFLDPYVAQFGFCLPQSLKLRHGQGKYLVRRWLHGIMPVSQPFSHKKGFTVPVGQWIYQKGALLGPLVAHDPAIAELCHHDDVIPLFNSTKRKDQEAAWRLLFYALWHRYHIRNLDPNHSVFECF
jgi:asparagine synthase (glutamine-hydrolysing)